MVIDWCADLGLQNDGEAMTMIPTYVTSVPKGTEKVSTCAIEAQIQILTFLGFISGS